MTTIRDVATIVRSKNAGPFQLTLDVFFETEERYQQAVNNNAIRNETIASAYGIEEAAIIGIYELHHLTAIKISFKRPTPAGSVEDSDVYGAQQHTPLLELSI